MRAGIVFVITVCFASLTSAEGGWQVGPLTVRNLASVPTFQQDADLTYNPRVATNLSIAPSYCPSKSVALTVGLRLSREWTRNDVQTSPNEVWLSDPTIGIGYPLYGGTDAPVTLSGSTTIHVPLSPTSRAASTITRIDQSITASTRLSKLALSYTARGSKLFHEFTTGQLEAPRLGACLGVECFRFMHTGVRNTSWSNSHLVSLSYAPFSRLRLSALGGVGLSYLYPLTDVDGLPEDEGPAFRYATLTQLTAQVEVVSGCSLRAGVENFYAQLRPDGVQQAFFFNRYANVFLDLVVSESLFTTVSKGQK